jgi:hypothetical protein
MCGSEWRRGNEWDVVPGSEGPVSLEVIQTAMYVQDNTQIHASGIRALWLMEVARIRDVSVKASEEASKPTTKARETQILYCNATSGSLA